ncbi:MAG TPA: FG-GAP-like repeat-containing protein [Dongiaceae bacterium]|nr:FG-GAP-like repeat-containing protein [Dongiaceae bacterium]
MNIQTLLTDARGSSCVVGEAIKRLSQLLCRGILLLAAAAASASAQTPGCAPGMANYPCAYVANSGSNTVSVINTISNSVIATISVGTSPEGVAISPDNSTVYVANTIDGTVSVIETATNTVKTTVTLQGFPAQIAVTPNGAFAYVTEPGASFEFSSFLEVIDTSTNAVVTSIAGVTEPFSVAIAPNGSTAYATDTCTVATASLECVEVIDTASNTITKTVLLPAATTVGGPTSIAVSPDGKFVYVMDVQTVNAVSFATLNAISTSKNEIATTYSVSGDNTNFSDYGLVVTPDSRFVYVAIPTTTGFTNSSTLSLVDTANPQNFLTNIFVGNAPTGAALTPDGAGVYVTNAADGTVSVVNTQSQVVTATITIGSGSSPQGVATMRVNPLPFINQPLVPDAIPAGGAEFTLTVNGTGFVSGATVNWNGNALTTTFVNQGQLTATVPGADIAASATASITVTNPAPGGGVSNTVPFTVTAPTNALTFSVFSDSVGTGAANVVAGDFNNDGIPDLAVVNTSQTASCYTQGGQGTISILLGNGDGTFTSAAAVCLPDVQGTVGLAGLAVADFNHDGKADLAATYSAGGVASNATYLGNGDGTFQPFVPGALAAFGTIGPPITGDFNGDGNLDLAIIFDNDGLNQVEVLLGDGLGDFSRVENFLDSSFGGPVVAGDFNGDGFLDLATVSSSSLLVLLGNGDGTFTPATTQSSVTLLNAASLTTADLNGDGKLDLAIADSGSNNVTILQGNGDGTFTQVSGEPTLPQFSNYVAAADFNGDGKLDLVFSEASCGNPDCPTTSIYILLGNGDGTFQAPINESSSNAPVALGVADFNRDGRLDVVSVNSADNTLSVYVQSGTPSLSVTQLSFGNQSVRTTSNALPVTFTNTGSATLFFGPISTEGGNPGDFSQTNNCPIVGQALALAPGASCIIDVSFTPTAIGARSATLSVGLDQLSATVALSGTGIDVLSISPTTLPNGNAGGTYNQALQVSGGVAPYTWAVSAGKLPPTLTLSASTGALSGTTTTAGAYSFTVQVTDSVGGSASQAYSIAVGTALAIQTTSLPGGTANRPYSQTLRATGGAAPYTWTLTAGSLPPSLTLSAGGVIAGTDTAAGVTSSFTVQVTDAVGSTASQQFTIVSAAAPSISTTSLPNGIVPIAYSQTLQASGGTAPLTWSIASGSLPPNLSLNSATGAISGSPTTAGSFQFTAQVSDANGGTAPQALTIQILSQLVVSSVSLPGGTAGVAYSQALQATGGVPPYAWTITGNLPGGLSLSSGIISGTPNAIGTFSFSATVTDANNDTASQSLSITISPASPTCTVALQLTPPLTVSATTSCVDPQGESLTTSIDWGDNSTPSIGSGGVITASHTYAASQQQQPYQITVTSTDTSQRHGTAVGSFFPPSTVPAINSGQTVNLTATISGGNPQGGVVTVTFECASVTEPDGTVIQGDQNISKTLGITCSSTTTTLTATAQQVPIVITTTGSASSSAMSAISRSGWLYAFWLPIPGLVLIGLGFGGGRLRRRRVLPLSALGMMLVLVASCGGGFNLPPISQTHTPAGSYQLTIVDQLQPPQQTGTSGFVQTSLIVPLTVN